MVGKHKHFNYKTKGEGVCMCFMSKRRGQRLNKYQQSASCWRRDIIKNKRRKGWRWCGRFLPFCCPSYVSVFRHHSSLTAQIKRGRERLCRENDRSLLFLCFWLSLGPTPPSSTSSECWLYLPFQFSLPRFLTHPFRESGGGEAPLLHFTFKTQ